MGILHVQNRDFKRETIGSGPKIWQWRSATHWWICVLLFWVILQRFWRMLCGTNDDKKSIIRVGKYTKVNIRTIVSWILSVLVCRIVSNLFGFLSRATNVNLLRRSSSWSVVSWDLTFLWTDVWQGETLEHHPKESQLKPCKSLETEKSTPKTMILVIVPFLLSLAMSQR